MEDLSRLSNAINLGFVGRQSPVPQRDAGKSITPSSNVNHHHSASSDYILIEEQPAWLDELLSEPTSPKMSSKGHRRAASDTAAYLNSALMPFHEDDLLKSHFSGPLWLFQNIERHDGHDGMWRPNFYDKHSNLGWELPAKNGNNLQRHGSCGAINRLCASTSKSVGKSKEGAPVKVDGPASKADSKRIKHQNAHRARLRRLEYISDLERTIQVLQAEGCEMSSAIHYLDQQLIILSMENRALKQRMDSLAEIQKLKHVEQQLLEREIGNLKFRRQQQQPQQNQNQMQQNRYNKYRPPTTQEPESQFAALAI